MADWTCRRTLCRVALVVVIIAAGLPAAPVSAAQMKLSGSLSPGTEVVGFQVSADGQYVVYAVGQVGDASGAVHALHSAAISGGSSHPLASVLPPASITSYQITPDGSRVVYIIQDAEGTGSAVYMVPIGGPDTATIRLSSPSGPPRVNGVAVSPDSGWVVYDADDVDSQRSELHSVPISPEVGVPITLHSAHINNQVSEYLVTPDSRTVVFTDSTFGFRNLYSVPIAGPASAMVSLLGSEEGSTRSFAVTPDSSWVIYSASWSYAPLRIYRVHTSGRDISAGPISRAFLPSGDPSVTPTGRAWCSSPAR